MGDFVADEAELGDVLANNPDEEVLLHLHLKKYVD